MTSHLFPNFFTLKHLEIVWNSRSVLCMKYNYHSNDYHKTVPTTTENTYFFHRWRKWLPHSLSSSLCLVRALTLYVWFFRLSIYCSMIWPWICCFLFPFSCMCTTHFDVPNIEHSNFFPFAPMGDTKIKLLCIKCCHLWILYDILWVNG